MAVILCLRNTKAKSIDITIKYLFRQFIACFLVAIQVELTIIEKGIKPLASDYILFALGKLTELRIIEQFSRLNNKMTEPYVN